MIWYICTKHPKQWNSLSIKKHHSIRYANINDRYLQELQVCPYNIFKDLYASQCRPSTDCLRLFSRSGKGLPGHEIITAVSLMHLLINLPRCNSIEISPEINELCQQIHLKRAVLYQKKKLWCVPQKEQSIACSPLSLWSHSQSLLWIMAYNISGTGANLTTLLLEPPGQRDLDFCHIF